MIPRHLHVVWVGDDAKCPWGMIETWREKNPNWGMTIWRNRDLETRAWRHRKWIAHFWGWEFCGVADVMRWQVLEEQGGFAIDADAPCLRTLDSWLFDVDAFACWENERLRPGLINNGFVACKPNDPLVKGINDYLDVTEPPKDMRAWQTTGPALLTGAWQSLGRHWTIWPSHLFLPGHFAGERYTGNGPVYAEQRWGSTVGYEGLDADFRSRLAPEAGAGEAEGAAARSAGKAQAGAAQGLEEQGEVRC